MNDIDASTTPIFLKKTTVKKGYLRIVLIKLIDMLPLTL